MGFLLLRRVTVLKSITNSLALSSCRIVFSSISSPFFGHKSWYSVSSRIHIPPLFPQNGQSCLKDCKIELVDDEAWQISSGLKDAWRDNEKKNEATKIRPFIRDQEYDNGLVNLSKEDPDFDEIEDMRLRGNLFYKLDKNSREYEEYKFEFHRRKPSKNEKKDHKESKDNKNKENSRQKLEAEIKKTSNKNHPRELVQSRCNKNESLLNGILTKKQRVPTFNQLTGPYHEPFCLDIYVSKGSVRASIIHRATSNVVAVSHSISKDLKFELNSTKNRTACAAVGEVLAKRALDDDIHNVVYTPRKGERLEGKLQIVLKSIMDGGVNVKVKLKQIKARKGGTRTWKTRE